MQEQAKDASVSRSSCAEALSSLIDGELDESTCRRLVERLCSDGQARLDWTMLNIACDALRSSEVAALHSRGFLERVSKTLASEPAIISRPRALRSRAIRRVVLPAGAVVAAVAVVVLVGVPQLRSPGGGSTPELVAVGGSAGSPRKPEPMVRSAELEAYLEAHRERSMGPLAPRANEFLPASAILATQPR